MKPTTETAGPAAVAELATVTGLIAQLEADHATISQQLGDQLAAQRIGDRKADPGKYASRRAAIESELRDLRLTAAALQATVTAWQSGQTERTRDAARSVLQGVTGDARALETKLAAQMEAAAETARQLVHCGQRWQKARQAAGACGVVDQFEAPRVPGRVVTNLVITHPRLIEKWLEPRRPTIYPAVSPIFGQRRPKPQGPLVDVPAKMHERAS